MGTDTSSWVRLTLEDDDFTWYAEFSVDGRIRAVHQFIGRRYVVAANDSRIMTVERDDMDLYHIETYRR